MFKILLPSSEWRNPEFGNNLRSSASKKESPNPDFGRVKRRLRRGVSGILRRPWSKEIRLKALSIMPKTMTWISLLSAVEDLAASRASCWEAYQTRSPIGLTGPAWLWGKDHCLNSKNNSTNLSVKSRFPIEGLGESQALRPYIFQDATCIGRKAKNTYLRLDYFP